MEIIRDGTDHRMDVPAYLMDIFDAVRTDVLTLESVFVTDVRDGFRLSVDSSDVWTLFACRSGEIEFQIGADEHGGPEELPTAVGGREGTATFGDVVISPPGALFRRRMVRPTAFLWARFDTSVDLPVGRTPIRDQVRFASDLDRLAAQPGPLPAVPAGLAPDTVAAHHVSDIVLLCLESQLAAVAPADDLADAAARLLTAEFTRPDLTVGELARRLSISPAALSRRFRSAHGTTPVAFLRDLRLQHARRLLVETGDSLAVVAQACGYADPFYFSRIFTRASGMPPTRFRLRNRF